MTSEQHDAAILLLIEWTYNSESVKQMRGYLTNKHIMNGNLAIYPKYNCFKKLHIG